MAAYNRTTRECPVGQLHPDLYQTIRKYFRAQNLGDDLEAETLMCCETISAKKNVHWLFSWLDDDVDKTIHTGMLLTSSWLIWARSGDQSGTVFMAANLKEIQVKSYTSILTKDTGLEVFGYIQDSKGRVRGYIGMGPELAAQKFCEQVQQAIEKANPPAKKRSPIWLAGYPQKED